MARGSGPVEEPEVNLARRLISRFGLTPPVDVRSLVERYADLEFDQIPGGIDAVCVGLKSPGRRPLVIVDSTKPLKRQRFTLAHELGHLVLPWHAGLIIDEIHLFEENAEEANIEAEANRFASELLAPTDWILSNFEIHQDAARAMADISARADISIPAAFVRLATVGPPGLVFAKERDGRILSSGKTRGTVATAPWGELDLAEVFHPMASHSMKNHGGETYHWWSFDDDAAGCEIDASDDWRELLSEIAASLGLPFEEEKKLKQSLNGLVASVNSQFRDGRSEVRLYNRIFQRLHSAAAESRTMRDVLRHPKCSRFVSARSVAFFSK